MNFYTLEQLVSVARQGCRFYAELYRGLPARGFGLEEVPIARFEDVMAAVHDDYRALFSSESAYGMCYTTSGTTGRPKATLFGRDEWRTVNQMLAAMHWKNGLLREGDVVCNISEPGSASFMAIHRVVDAFPGRCSEIPIGCDTEYSNIIRVCQQFRASVIAGMSPTILGLAETTLRESGPNPHVERLLGGGELFYGAQMDLIRHAFPRAQFAPFMYGATEAGMIGYGELSMPANHFRAFEGLCRVEIVDTSTGQPIREPGRIGRVVITSFVRLAAPAIRLETGDLAQWVDEPQASSPRFALAGRLFPFSKEVAGVSLGEDDVWRVVQLLEGQIPLLRLQLVFRGTRDAPLIEVVTALYRQLQSSEEVEKIVEEAVFSAIPKLRLGGTGLKVRTRGVEFSHFSPATRRKSRLIVDQREGGI